MNRVLQTYLTRTFATQALACVAALTALLQALDLLDNATDILQRHLGIRGIGYYLALRLPTVVDQVLTIGVLIASIMTFRNLARHNEITVLRAAGITTYKMAILLLPVITAIALFQFVLKDQITPRTERALSVWWQATQLHDDNDDASIKPLWFRVGPCIVSARHVGGDGRLIEGVEIYWRENSMLTRRVVAERAEEKTGQWLLRNAMETGLRDGVAISETPQDMVWKIKLSPQNLLRLTAPNARLSVSAARDALNGSEASSRTPSFYQMQIYETYALPFASFVMLLLGLPSAFTHSRDKGAAWLPFVGAAMGLLFVLTTGILISLGQAGTLPPFLAISTSFIVFGTIAASQILLLEESV